MSWVIEASHRKAQSGGTLYLTVQGQRDCVTTWGGKLIWWDNYDEALHFGRKEDCYLFLQAVSGMMDNMPYKLTVEGLRKGDHPPFVREHLYINGEHKPQ